MMVKSALLCHICMCGMHSGGHGISLGYEGDCGERGGNGEGGSQLFYTFKLVLPGCALARAAGAVTRTAVS